MARYGGYRRWRTGARRWSQYHNNKHNELAEACGGIERDILHIFLNLPTWARDGLLGRYGDKYGRDAERYARKTYSDWKAGTTRPSGQTVERLVSFLPLFLSDEQRFELVRKLRAHHFKRQSLFLDTTPECWRDDLKPLIKELLNAQSDVPEFVIQRATWLAKGDVMAARKLLHAIDADEAELRLSFIEAEFRRIELLLGNVKNLEPVRHEIKLPQGDIFVTIKNKRPALVNMIAGLFRGDKPMENENEKMLPQVRPGAEVVRRTTPGSIVDSTLEKLPAAQQRKLADKVAEEKLRSACQPKRQNKGISTVLGTWPIPFARQTRWKETTRSDYEVSGTFDTASGRTDIRIKKNNNTVIIVVAVVVGIVILLLLKH